MTPVNLHKFYLPAVIVLLAGLAFVGYEWMKAHDANLMATYEAKTQSAIRSHLEQDASDAKKSFTATGKHTDQKVKVVQQAAAKPMDSAQIQALIKAALPKVEVQEIKGPGNIDYIALPDTPEVRAEIQQKDAECKIAGIKLEGCNSQLVDMTILHDKAQATADSWQKESGSWQNAAHAHQGFWKGLKDDAIKLGIAFGAGYALAHR